MHYQLYSKVCRQIRGSPCGLHPALMAAPKTLPAAYRRERKRNTWKNKNTRWT